MGFAVIATLLTDYFKLSVGVPFSQASYHQIVLINRVSPDNIFLSLTKTSTEQNFIKCVGPNPVFIHSLHNSVTDFILPLQGWWEIVRYLERNMYSRFISYFVFMVGIEFGS